MSTQQEVDVLCDFVRILGRTVDRRVDLTCEGDDDRAFATYDPRPDEFGWLD